MVYRGLYHVASPPFEPSDGTTISTHDPFLIRLDVGKIILFEANTALRQLVVLHRYDERTPFGTIFHTSE